MNKILLAKIQKPYRKLNTIGTWASIFALTVEVEGYTGPLITVYSHDTSTNKAIYAMPNGKLDWPNLLAHCNSEDGDVITIHDQLENSDATGGNPPRIVNEGVLVTENGEPAISFDNTNDYLESSLPYSASEPVVSILTLATIKELGESDVLVGQDGTNGIELRKLSSDIIRIDTRRVGGITTCSSTNTLVDEQTVLVGAVADRTNIKLYEDGELITTVSDSDSDFNMNTKFRISAGSGAYSGARLQFVGVSLNDESENMLEYYNELSTRYGINGESAQTINVASSTYTTKSTGDYANTTFYGRIKKELSIEKELGFFVWGTESTIAVSSLYLENNGEYDDLLDPNMIDTSVVLELIDNDAAYSTAVQIGEFIIDDVSNPDDYTIKIDLVSKISLLDRNTVHEHFPDTIQFVNNQDQPEPLAIGSVNQVAIARVDATDNIYEMTSESTVNSVIDVKDRADPLVLTTDYSIVTVTETGGRGIDLVSPPDGTITASYKGANYNGQPTDEFDNFVGKLLVDYAELSTSDIDLTSAATINTNLAYKYGCYISSGTNIKNIMDTAVASHCGFYFQNNDGEISFGVLESPTTSSDLDVVQINLSSGVKKSVDRAPGLSDSVASKKNWHVYTLDEVRDISGLSEEDKETVSSEFAHYSRSTITTAGGRVFHGAYAHARNGDYIKSLLADESHAHGLIGQLEDLYGVARSHYDFEYLAEDVISALTLELNDIVKLTHNRYGLDNGKYLRVTKIKIDNVLENEMKIRGWG